jgi:hypothetical protein
MNLLLTSFVQMLTRLVTFAESSENTPVTNTVIIFKNGISFIKSRLQNILGLNQIVSLTGIAADKDLLKQILCKMTLTITKPAKSFAILKKNLELKNSLITAYTKLLQMKADDLVAWCREVKAIIEPLIEEMTTAGYSVTDSDLESWMDAVDAFETLITSPQSKIANRKTINARIVTMVRECMAECRNNLDLNIVSFKNNPEYVAEYYNQRHVINTNVHHTNFECSCMFQDSQSPVYPVLITVHSDKPKSAPDKIDGTARIEKVQPGNWKVSATYQNQTITTDFMKFEKGHTVVFTFAFDSTMNIPAPQETKQKVKN